MKLGPEQESLLATLVQAAHSVPRSERYEFTLTRHDQADLVHGPGLASPQRIPASDVYVLRDAGVIAVSEYTESGGFSFYVTPQGFSRYEEQQRREDQGEQTRAATSADGARDVFISYASEDKDQLARPLAEALQERGHSVWFDDYELTLGDSLRRTIDNGLANSRFGLVILSPSFFGKGWPQRELDGLTARETAGGESVILPIWHQVDEAEVRRYSPPLADRWAARSSEGIEIVVDKVARALDRRP